MIISVIGGSDCRPGDRAYQVAEEVGRELAQRGVTVVCGGLKGVMEAAAKGAQAAGGLTIGILPGDNRKEANPYISIPIPTGLGVARNAIVVKAGQAVIAIDGAYGTLSEIGIALSESIPVVGLATWELGLEGRPITSAIPAKDPAEAVVKALEAARQGENNEFKHWRNS